MKHMLAGDAWSQMIDQDPVVQLIQANLKLAFPPTGKCQCDVCKRTIENTDMVYQDEQHPITVCEECFDPQTEYCNLNTENRISVKFVRKPKVD